MGISAHFGLDGLGGVHIVRFFVHLVRGQEQFLKENIIKRAADELRRKLRETNVSEADLAQEIGIARGTLRKVLSNAEKVSYRAAVVSRLASFLGVGYGNVDPVYKFFETGLDVQGGDRQKLRDLGTKHYTVYKLYSKRQSVLVTHLTLSTEGGATTFVDRSVIRSPFSQSSGKQAEFTHRGLVFHKRTTVYFLSAESSNLRLISVPASDFFNFNEASGLILGTNTDFPYATRIYIKAETERVAKGAKGHYETTAANVREILSLIQNETEDQGVLAPRQHNEAD